MNMTTRLDGDTESVTDLGTSDVIADLEAIFINCDTKVDGIDYYVEPIDAAAGTARLLVGDKDDRQRWFVFTLTEIPVED